MLGKDDSGTLYFRIDHTDPRSLRISYQDDGGGIDLSKIYGKALKKGLLNENCSPEEIVEMIFASGFSTSEHTTMISGRGVGMDAVRRTARKLGGELKVALQEEVRLEEIHKNSSRKVAFTFELVLPVDKDATLAA